MIDHQKDGQAFAVVVADLCVLTLPALRAPRRRRENAIVRIQTVFTAANSRRQIIDSSSYHFGSFYASILAAVRR